MARASFVQHGIAVTERLSPGTTTYHMPVVVRFDRPVDAARLARACDRVVARHPLLAAALAEHDGATEVVAAPPPRLDVLGGRSVAEEIARPFDRYAGPLARFALCDPATLVVTAHHLVFDGHSKDILVRDLAAAYRGETLAAPAADHAAHAADERRRVEQDFGAAGEFWRTRAVEPADPHVAGVRLTGRGPGPGRETVFTLRPPGVAGVTAFESVLAVVHVLLSRYGNAAPTTAVDLSTRGADMADVIGPFVNELPVSSRPREADRFDDLARALRVLLRETYAYRHVPIGRALPGGRPYAALAPLSVSYRRRGPDPDFGDIAARTDWLAFNGGVRGDLQLQLVDDDGSITASLRYSAAAAPLAEGFAAGLRAVADRAAADPTTPLGGFGRPADPAMPTAAPSVPAVTAPSVPAVTAPSVPAVTEPLPAAVTEPLPAAVTAPLPAAVTAPSPAADPPGAGDVEIREQLRGIWEEVLRIAPIADDDDLFDLGGHSLTMTQIIARTRASLSVEVPLNAFFDDPTIAGVARVVAAHR